MSPRAEARPADPVAKAARPPLVIGCGALANELVELTRRAGLPAMDLTCLPASLHNRPERIPDAVARRIQRARADGYDRIFVAYADCGTGGMLDRVLEAEGVARLEGAHCYEVYAGRAAFAALHDAEPGTFYLTDFLVRNFDRLVVRGLGLDRHPELLPLYFGNYRRLIYLAQTDDAALTARAEAGAARLGLAFERRLTGLGELTPAIAAFARPSSVDRAPDPDPVLDPVRDPVLDLVLDPDPEPGGPSLDVLFGRRPATARPKDVITLHLMSERDAPRGGGASRATRIRHSRSDSSVVVPDNVRNGRSMKVGVGMRPPKKDRDARAGTAARGRARSKAVAERAA